MNYIKSLQKEQKKSLILNRFWTESFNGSLREENMISFRVMHLFKNCFLLALYLLKPKRFEEVFQIKKNLANHSKFPYKSKERYFLDHIENEIDYLKRIYRLKSRPFDTIRNLFGQLFNVIDKLGNIWRKSTVMDSAEPEKNKKPTKLNAKDVNLATDIYQEENEKLFDLIRKEMLNFKENAMVNIKKRYGKMFEIIDKLPKKDIMRMSIGNFKGINKKKSSIKIQKDFISLFSQSLKVRETLDLINIKEGLIIQRISNKNSTNFLKYYFDNKFCLEQFVSQIFFINLEFGSQIGNLLEHQIKTKDLYGIPFVKQMKNFQIDLTNEEEIKELMNMNETNDFKIDTNQNIARLYSKFKNLWKSLNQNKNFEVFQNMIEFMKHKTERMKNKPKMLISMMN